MSECNIVLSGLLGVVKLHGIDELPYVDTAFIKKKYFLFFLPVHLFMPELPLVK